VFRCRVREVHYEYTVLSVQICLRTLLGWILLEFCAANWSDFREPSPVLTRALTRPLVLTLILLLSVPFEFGLDEYEFCLCRYSFLVVICDNCDGVVDAFLSVLGYSKLIGSGSFSIRFVVR